MSKKRFLPGFFLFLFFLVSGLSIGSIPVFVSDDSSLVLVTNDDYNGLSVVNTETGQSTMITTGINAGYYATISPDNRYVCYKAFQESADGLLQIPVIYDLVENASLELCLPAPLTGTPAVSVDGKIAYTLGDNLYILGSNGKVSKIFDLGCDVNIVSFSPDGKKISYSKDNGEIVVLEVGGKAIKTFSTEDAYLWGPAFSPNGDKILVKSIEGKVGCVSLEDGKVDLLGEGLDPSWIDNETIGCIKKEIEDFTVKSSDLVTMDCSGIVISSARLDWGNVDGVIKLNAGAFNISGSVQFGSISTKAMKSGFKTLSIPAELNEIELKEAKIDEEQDSEGKNSLKYLQDKGTTWELVGVPVIHQV
ncbi:hypothetical protein JW926_09375, partial [Candidatus Sumerlaeota bacterium]|nr:hypothetical protein [Candidatus Sumerlaeota bacterium]